MRRRRRARRREHASMKPPAPRGAVQMPVGSRSEVFAGGATLGFAVFTGGAAGAAGVPAGLGETAAAVAPPRGATKSPCRGGEVAVAVAAALPSVLGISVCTGAAGSTIGAGVVASTATTPVDAGLLGGALLTWRTTSQP